MSHFFKKPPKSDAGPSGSRSEVSLPSQKQLVLSSQTTTTPSCSSLKLLEHSGVSANNNSAVEALRPFVIEYTLMSEYFLLHKNNVQGVYVVPSAGSALKWFGVLFVRKGLYQGGIFRFTIYIPDNFPECHAPLVVFEPSIFHPLINIETGELDVKRAFPKWRRHSNHLWQVVLYTKQVFTKIETHNPLNPEAATLYEKDMELYKLKIAENMSICRESLYSKPTSEDNHAIWFTPFDTALHKDYHFKILNKKVAKKEEDGVNDDEDEDESKGAKSGLTWVHKGNILEKNL